MLLIANGTVIDPANSINGLYDILIDSGSIADVQPQGSFSTVQTLLNDRRHKQMDRTWSN